MNTYVDVIVPVPVDGQFTYRLPAGMHVSEGNRVVVPFGQKKYYTAIVTRLHSDPPKDYEVKDVLERLDEKPVLFPEQYALWQWIAQYYLCTIGEVYKAAFPAGMKIESETIVTISPSFDAKDSLNERERYIVDLLENGNDAGETVTTLERKVKAKNLLPLINRLIEKGAVAVREELKRSYKPRVESYVRLTDGASNEKMLHMHLDMLSKATKQLAVLMKYLELSGWMRPDRPLKEVSRIFLLTQADATSSVLNALVEKKILEVYQKEVGRLSSEAKGEKPVNELSLAQQQAYDEILSAFETKQVCLLHGVTSSGKTEIYIHLIQKALSEGKQVLYLLPEIALTTQITDRLKRVFGDRLGVYHSKFPDAERVEIWQKQLTDHDYDVILGVRSSVFLPFRRLGLVIIDEEHEMSYKQQDPAPRYHARSAALMLASKFGAKTLLGTATPSIESYYHATHGKYGLVTLGTRHGEIRLPRVEVVDIKELFRKKMMATPQFSPLLFARIREALGSKEQVILFQNRRGFAPMIECRLCGWVPKCRNCDVSLTYHKSLNQLTCHYCGSTYPVPSECPACGGKELLGRGFGTERIEDDVKQNFPEARVARMDLDTTRTRTSYERIIADFEQGKTDILIGTQMVSKGLDFDRVSVVGILNADSMLNYPDFRSHERAFQLMVQVAGRAGRKHKQGLVVLQTKSPDLPLIHQVVSNDYDALYNGQIAERSLFKYPPFYRLVYMYLKHRKEDVLEQAAALTADYLRRGMGDRVLGPDRPPVARIQTYFIKKIVIKIEQSASMSKVRDYLLQVQQAVRADERFRMLLVYYDVDPM